MALNNQTPQQPLTPETRRAMLCAFADRMLVKVTSMDDPDDLPGVERAVRVAAVIERIYSRCDRALAQAPDPNKLEAERAQHVEDAIKARVKLAGTLEWGEQRRKALGAWWDAAAPETQIPVLAPATAPAPAPSLVRPAPAQPVHKTAAVTLTAALKPAQEPIASPAAPKVQHVDHADAILKARTDMGLNDAGELPAPSGETESPAAAQSSSSQLSGQTGSNLITERPEDSGPRIRSLDSRWPPP